MCFLLTKKYFGGGVTKGDIERYLRCGGDNLQLDRLINTQIRYITYYDEEQVFVEAKKIFEGNWRIKNIPIIDTLGKLLFQIDRYSREEHIKDILEAERNGSIGIFLRSDVIEKIVLTGADRDILQAAKRTLGYYCQKMDLARDYSIDIKEDVQECCYVDKSVKVICLNDKATSYINQNTKFQTNVVSAKELASFVEFSKIKKIDEEIINDWKNIFGYEAVAMYPHNRYTGQLMQMIKKCGVQLCDIKPYIMQEINRNNDLESSFDVLLFSKGRQYCEKTSIFELIRIWELLLRYKQISGNHLTMNKYTKAGVVCLKSLQEEGFEGVLFEVNNECREKLKSKLETESDLDVVNKWEDMSSGKKYVIDAGCFQKWIEGNFVYSLKDRILKSICEYEVYKIINILCKNVFLYPVQYHIYDGFQSYLERTRYNFIHHREIFMKNFVGEICGDENYPLDKVVQDMEDCQTVKINDGYMKFLSNYHSQYFNTDIYGNRVVIDAPLEFSKKIWLIGACNFAGYAVEDKHTFASCLQKKVNEAGYPYRVVDLSCEGVLSYDLYNKILDQKIDSDDIVIVLEQDLILKEKEIRVNYNEISRNMGEEIWYWDTIGHPGYKGYEILAGEFFDAIRSNMVTGMKNFTFHVESNLEVEIKGFIAELKSKLNKGEHRKDNVCIDFNMCKKNKVGAIVMNCNPFTYGHQYLVETASRLVDLLYIFVVEEDKSVFPFTERIRMVEEGVKQFQNVVVFPSGKFMISTITFPGYFLKDSPTRECYDTFLDLKIFARYIAPEFGISMRFVGEELTDKVTAQYNIDMKEILSGAGIDVIEIPRKRCGEEIISASKVRKLLRERDYNALGKYVPSTTMKYFANKKFNSPVMEKKEVMEKI